MFTGVIGMALTGQLSNFMTVCQVLASGGISSGVIKYVAEYNEDLVKRNKVEINSFIIIFVCSIVVSLSILLGINHWSVYIFGKIIYKDILVITAFTVPMYSINLYLISLVNGLKLYPKLVKINIINSLIGLTISLILIYYEKLWGALVATVSFQGLPLLYTFYMVFNEKTISIREYFSLKIDKEYIKKLLGYTLISFSTTLAIPISYFIIRKLVVSELNLFEAGIWDGMTKISLGLITLINTSLTAYYLPKLSELKSNGEIKKEILKTGGGTLLITFAICLITYIFRDHCIELLFTKDFFKMREIFFFELTGDFFRLSGWLFSCYLFAKARTLEMMVIETFFTIILFVCLSYLLIPLYGIKGICIGYLINYFFYFLFMLFYVFRILNK